MRYADSLLIEGEEVALRTRQHWLAVVLAARHGLLLWIIGVGLLVGGLVLDRMEVAFLRPGTAGANVLGWIVIALFVVGLVILLLRLWQWWAQDYMITNRRLMKVWGVLNKRSVDSALEKVNDAQLDQSVFGRIFNYGHLDILTASAETDLDDYDMISDPKGFKRTMLTQKHALEMSYYRGAPAPPMRAEMDMNGEPLPPPAVPPPAPGTMAALADAPVPANEPDAPIAPAAADSVAPASQPAAEPTSSEAPPADKPLEVTQTLARLADLRDRGAITEEEYAAKKQELLDRL